VHNSEGALIEVDHLSKSYGKNVAVNDISFTVGKGEILGFLGPNGAGKTTTMRILTGYLPATTGSARIAGFDVFEQSIEVRRRIGYLPETPPLYGDMNVRSYLEFVGRIKGVASADLAKRVERAMELANLTQKRTELIKRLSRGFRQRVGIAQAIVHNPDVVILDEPTVGLDPKQIIEVRKLIKGLAGEHTIILSTHILPEASQTCDRVVIINRGRIAAVDTPENLTTQLKGSERVLLEVKGSEDSLRDAIEQVSGATKVDIEPLDGTERLKAIVESESGTELRSQLAAAVIAKGLELFELRAVSLSLEDIFLQLTTEEGAPPKQPATVTEKPQRASEETTPAEEEQEATDESASPDENETPTN
jgi:gliding motility-associated transport system ATP-binding protein